MIDINFFINVSSKKNISFQIQQKKNLCLFEFCMFIHFSSQNNLIIVDNFFNVMISFYLRHNFFTQFFIDIHKQKYKRIFFSNLYEIFCNFYDDKYEN